MPTRCGATASSSSAIDSAAPFATVIHSVPRPSSSASSAFGLRWPGSGYAVIAETASRSSASTPGGGPSGLIFALKSKNPPLLSPYNSAAVSRSPPCPYFSSICISPMFIFRHPISPVSISLHHNILRVHVSTSLSVVLSPFSQLLANCRKSVNAISPISLPLPAIPVPFCRNLSFSLE